MGEGQAVGQVDFSGLVLGFCSAALSYMGYSGGETQKNLILARQNIDILDILAQKTLGNLTPDEERLLRDVLQDLKLKFVEQSSK